MKMLLRNKEPSVTKNLDFSRHLPSKEGRISRLLWHLIAFCVNKIYRIQRIYRASAYRTIGISLIIIVNWIDIPKHRVVIKKHYSVFWLFYCYICILVILKMCCIKCSYLRPACIDVFKICLNGVYFAV